jgi:hypothetical protein
MPRIYSIGLDILRYNPNHRVIIYQLYQTYLVPKAIS